MFARMGRIAASFAIVVIAYWGYVLAVVPWIEPAVALRQSSAAAALDVDPSRLAVARQREELACWFKPGDWELTSPKILETPQGIVLVDSYHNHDDGRVEIRPCTMIFLPEGQFDSEEERKRRAIILRAPEGAILQFDSPPDLKLARIGKLVAGRLVGRITIHSDQKHPGAHDDLRIVTRDVELSEERIVTPHWIDFQFGPNRGKGRQLEIRLSDRSQPAREQGYGGVTSLALLRDIETQIVPGTAELFPGAAGQAGAPPNAAAAEGTPQPPVAIRCQGPFHFDLVEYVARFENQVDVVRSNPHGPADQMNCERLSIFFEPSGEASGPDDPRPKLEPVRLEATGNPVVIRAPSRGVQARGEQVEYDIRSGAAKLGGRREVILRQGQREIGAGRVEFTPDASGRLGTFLAVGPGWLRGALPDDERQWLVARWSKLLHFRPHDGNQLLSLEGDARVEVMGQGVLSAEEIYLWLRETPSRQNAVRTELVPDRMLARQRVEFDHPQLAGAVDQLECWFEDLAQPHRAGPVAARTPPGPAERAQTAGALLGPSPSVPPGAGPADLGGGVNHLPMPDALAAAPPQKFRVEGRLLRLRVQTEGGQRPHLAEVVVDRGVRFAELPAGRSDERPLLVVGDQLRLVQASPGAAVVTVAGQPAHVEARGMTLDSNRLVVDRGRNVLAAQSQGLMTLPVDRNLQGEPTAESRPLELAWQGQMEFDGRTARFYQGVVARVEFQLLRTELLEVVFSEPVRFAEVGAGRPDIHSVVCRQGVYLENRAFQGRQLKSIDRMEVRALAVEQRSGDLSAQGPGWITSLRAGVDALTPHVVERGQRSGANPGATHDDVTYLRIEFQGAMTGNVHRREIALENEVRTVYGPVLTWDAAIDPDRPEQWPEQTVLLRSDRLQVSEAPPQLSPLRSYELAAMGNAEIEGQTFFARASRLTYAQAKDLLVLEGEGHDAELFHQPRPGARRSRLSARKIMYWPTTKRVEVEDARELNLSELPGGSLR